MSLSFFIVSYGFCFDVDNSGWNKSALVLSLSAEVLSNTVLSGVQNDQKAYASCLKKVRGLK